MGPYNLNGLDWTLTTFLYTYNLNGLDQTLITFLYTYNLNGSVPDVKNVYHFVPFLYP